MKLIDINDNKDDKIIYQHNTITSGKYDYSACMLDILFMVLCNLQQNKREYTIEIQDIEAITGRKWNTTQLVDTTSEMLTKMFSIGNSNNIQNEDYIQFVLFQSFKYHKGERTITIKLSEEALPLFFELKNNFTVMQLKSVLGCSSKYAKRLYAIGCQWRKVGVKRYEIKELKDLLGMINNKGKELFKRISDFKKFVLDIAMHQINNNTDIEMSYELRKRGRSYHWITFNINQKQGIQLEIDFKEPIENQKFKSKVMAYKLSEEQAQAIVQNEKEKDFDILITELNDKIRQGKLKVDNATAYLVGVYQKKGIIEKKNR